MSDEYRSDIWRLQAQYNVEGLIQALSAHDAGIRRRAAVALRAIFAKQALEALRKALATEDNEEARQSMQAAIETLQAADADEPAPPPVREPSIEERRVQRLIDLLKKDDPRQVMYAARELANLKHKLAVEPLMMIFNNPGFPTVVRLAVAEALLKLEGAPAEVALLANLRNPEWETRRKAAAILGQLKATWAVPPLAKALRDPHPLVRRTARAALVYMDTAEAKRVLAQMPDETDPNSKSTELRKVQSPPATSRLLRRMDDPTSPDETTNDGPNATTIPAPPRQRLADRANAKAAAPTPNVPPAVHTMATQPLDPSAVEKAEQHQQDTKTEQPKKPDESS